MAILQTDANGLALTDNTGKPILYKGARHSTNFGGHIVQASYGDTTTPTHVTSTSFVPTTLSAQITTTSSPSNILAQVFTSKNIQFQGDSVITYFDLMVSGGSFGNNTTVTLSGASNGFGSAATVHTTGLTVPTTAVYQFLHNHGQSANTTLTYTVAARRSSTGNGMYVNGFLNQALYKTTIILYEIVVN